MFRLATSVRTLKIDDLKLHSVGPAISYISLKIRAGRLTSFGAAGGLDTSFEDKLKNFSSTGFNVSACP